MWHNTEYNPLDALNQITGFNSHASYIQLGLAFHQISLRWIHCKCKRSHLSLLLLKPKAQVSGLFYQNQRFNFVTSLLLECCNCSKSLCINLFVKFIPFQSKKSLNFESLG